VSASVTVMDRSGLPSATAAGIGGAGGVRHAVTPIAMGTDTGTGMGVERVTGQGIGPAAEILAAIICTIHNATRHAPKPNLPEPINGKQLPGPPPGGLTTFTPTGTATSTARQTRDGSSAVTRVGSQKTGLPRPSNKGTGRLKPSSNRPNRARARCKGTSRPRPSSRERSNSKPSSLTAATRHGSRAAKEPQVIISPAAAVAVAAVEVVAVEVAVVGAVAVVANNLSQ